jgi:nitroimidazol reductase NimA-like FMN-containing flavoprotein (pyridoxamine 5'-phosphate oxidase superfamily)
VKSIEDHIMKGDARSMTANNPLTPARKLTSQEVADLTALAIPAHLATFDLTGFPRVIPLWFLWEDEIFYMSSGPKSRHVQDLVRDSRAGLCITIEEGQTQTGYRPFRQIMVQGYAQVQPDLDGKWASKLIRKYITGQAGEVRVKLEAGKPHVVIALRPEHF